MEIKDRLYVLDGSYYFGGLWLQMWFCLVVGNSTRQVGTGRHPFFNFRNIFDYLGLDSDASSCILWFIRNEEGGLGDEKVNVGHYYRRNLKVEKK